MIISQHRQRYKNNICFCLFFQKTGKKAAVPQMGTAAFSCFQLFLFSGLTQQCHAGALGYGSPFSQA